MVGMQDQVKEEGMEDLEEGAEDTQRLEVVADQMVEMAVIPKKLLLLLLI